MKKAQIIHRIMKAGLAMQERTGHHFFGSYSGHIDSIRVYVNDRGSKYDGKTASERMESFDVYLDWDEVLIERRASELVRALNEIK